VHPVASGGTLTLAVPKSLISAVMTRSHRRAALEIVAFSDAGTLASKSNVKRKLAGAGVGRSDTGTDVGCDVVPGGSGLPVAGARVGCFVVSLTGLVVGVESGPDLIGLSVGFVVELPPLIGLAVAGIDVGTP
jgi:hypothetical protein